MPLARSARGVSDAEEFRVGIALLVAPKPVYLIHRTRVLSASRRLASQDQFED